MPIFFNQTRVPPHYDFDSPAHPGERFPVRWIGNEPDASERREYIRAYCEWMSPNEMHRYGELRDYADRAITLALKKAQWKEVPGKFFAYMSDMITWKCFFERSRPNEPEWPWKKLLCPDPSDVVMSHCYDRLRLEDDSALEPPHPVPAPAPVPELVLEPVAQPKPAARSFLQVAIPELLSPRSTLLTRSKELEELYNGIDDIRATSGLTVPFKAAQIFDRVQGHLLKEMNECGVTYTEKRFTTPPMNPVPLDDFELDQLKHNKARKKHQESTLNLLSPPKDLRHTRKENRMHRNRSVSTGAESSLFVADDESISTSHMQHLGLKRLRSDTPTPEPNAALGQEHHPMAGFMKTLYAISKHLRLDVEGEVGIMTLISLLMPDRADGAQSRRLHDLVNRDTDWICFKTLLEKDLTGCSTEELERTGCAKHDGDCHNFLRLVSLGHRGREMQFKTIRHESN
ncbi:uncharacterized protein NECHADRAFT_80952 [Fusarium vanettenii 77-13-4]|uniref:Uncharacterized protein n=1 Tax=Fusarium vanettenii (strain ATCC MYA-4622 / CBS 123669 / FGSC 9596 / NRRL 45880 / 77-13-4) TaxID=660122 RepID=C7YT52_FUSV7|nr:uncharacterized protein NECHADRAFT_80952 [Fusarium vanettenii 77-13-4]EEU45350.1 predicted protein [Fusarium vanettenii 77-13-4]